MPQLGILVLPPVVPPPVDLPPVDLPPVDLPPELVGFLTAGAALFRRNAVPEYGMSEAKPSAPAS
jgi:hypothetical protein